MVRGYLCSYNPNQGSKVHNVAKTQTSVWTFIVKAPIDRGRARFISRNVPITGRPASVGRMFLSVHGIWFSPLHRTVFWYLPFCYPFFLWWVFAGLKQAFDNRWLRTICTFRTFRQRDESSTSGNCVFTSEENSPNTDHSNITSIIFTFV